jgi:hypothetical protein
MWKMWTNCMNSSRRDWIYELMYVLKTQFSGGMLLSDLENCEFCELSWIILNLWRQFRDYFSHEPYEEGEQTAWIPRVEIEFMNSCMFYNILSLVVECYLTWKIVISELLWIILNLWRPFRVYFIHQPYEESDQTSWIPRLEVGLS